jgi:hypothetical protein
VPVVIWGISLHLNLKTRDADKTGFIKMIHTSFWILEDGEIKLILSLYVHLRISSLVSLTFTRSEYFSLYLFPSYEIVVTNGINKIK